MINFESPVLCGGTFLTQILQSRKPTVSRRQRTKGKTDTFGEPDVLFELIKLVQPDYIKPSGNTFKTYTSNYKKCADHTPDDLKFENEMVITAFLGRLETDYAAELHKVTLFANQFIDIKSTTQNDVLLIKRLIELIRDDKDIPDEDRFVIRSDGTSISKAELKKVKKVNLPAFLLDVWKFIVTDPRDNSIGSATIAAWYQTTTKGRYTGIDGSTISQEIIVECDVIEAHEETSCEKRRTEEIAVETVKKYIMPDVYTYLRNVEDKYETTKTLLDKHVQKPFYSFFICNTIRHRITNSQEEPLSSKNFRIIEEATILKISQHTKFAVLCGTGGLGKSMMMRHLLLNTIHNYDDLKLFPVFVSLKDYDGAESALIDYIYSKVSVHDSRLAFEKLEEMLVQGVCVLLLDGFDEIGAGYTQRFERELEALTDKYSKNIFILSSRPFQSFISFERFSLLELMPFTPRQAMQLIDRLEFREDEPEIKKKFLASLEKSLFRTHRTFTENPLLLTIMLLTFEEFAEVPSKMHIFYRAAFEVLAREHDNIKGSYKRPLNTGLEIDVFKDYFAELCFRAYNDKKLDLSEDEFAAYYNVLNARIMANDKKTTVRDFIEDICSNLCLMYFEGTRFYFTHGSFQEYFCALFFSKQKDVFISDLGEFFEEFGKRMNSDRIFYMLYDMIPGKVEEYIFLPFLTDLFDKCKNADGYWTFIEKIYPKIPYSSKSESTISHLRLLEPSSFIFSIMIEKSGFNWGDEFLAKLPFYEPPELKQFKDIGREIIINRQREEINEDDTIFLWHCNIAEIRRYPDENAELLKELNDDNFILKKLFHATEHYMNELDTKHKKENKNLRKLLKSIS